MIWRVPVLVTIVSALYWYVVRPITDQQAWSAESTAISLCGEAPRTSACVIDGDTILISQSGQRPRRIRLTGYDAPELDGACEAERKLALQARRTLAQWLARGPFEWTGADDPPFDQYGRELREVRRAEADGKLQLLADFMIGSGLASESGWGASPTDWCA
ncbi:MAG: thermonuclease family protein [Pseudomonadota bacterium]|nr:thermonuclease family protein [Pseudomonadota bacterium]